MELIHKEKFVYTDAISYFETLKSSQIPAWGVMNAQQMLEHLSDSVAMANGHAPQQLITAEEHVDKWKAFAMSDKDFKPNTPNALLGETPPDMRHESIAVAFIELQSELKLFQQFYQNNPLQTQMNPFFGPLNYAEWINLFYKHFRHHLRQFMLID